MRKEEKIDRKSEQKLYSTMSKLFYKSGNMEGLTTYVDYFQMRSDDNFGLYGCFNYKGYSCMIRIHHSTVLPCKEDKKEGYGGESNYVCEFFIPLPDKAVMPDPSEPGASLFDEAPHYSRIYRCDKKYIKSYEWDDDVERPTIFQERFKESLDDFISGIAEDSDLLDATLGKH